MLRKTIKTITKSHQNSTEKSNQKWMQTAKQMTEGGITYNGKYLGCIDVDKAKGVAVVKDAIRKLKISHDLKKSEAGHKGSKLQRVEIQITIDAVKIVDAKSRHMVCNRPLHRVSYCADDHTDKRLFAFIAKDQSTKTHNCFVLICDKEAAEVTLSFGQVFQLAYKRYQKEKSQIIKTKEVIDLGKRIEEVTSENARLKEQLQKSSNSTADQNSTPASTQGAMVSISPPPSTAREPPMSPQPEPRFDASFDTGTDINNGGGDLLSIFSPTSTPRDPQSQFQSQQEGDLFQNADLFANDQQCGRGKDTDSMNSHDFFDMIGRSPTEQDFEVMYDPFADIPDWSSQASEEVAPSLPDEPSNLFQSFDVFDQQPTNPFAAPVAPSNGTLAPVPGPFNGTTANPYNGAPLTPFNGTLAPVQSYNRTSAAPEADLFGQYLSNVATRGDSFTTPTKNDNNNNNSSIDTLLFDPLEPTNSAAKNNSNNKPPVNMDFAKMNLSGFSPFDETEDSFSPNSHFSSQAQNTATKPYVSSQPPTSAISQTPSSNRTVRPRPTPNKHSSQPILRAPPTKQSIKASSIGPPHHAKSNQPSVTANLAGGHQRSKTTEHAFQPNNGGGILPNVERASPATNNDDYRTRSKSNIQSQLQTMSQVSKSLEDLDRL